METQELKLETSGEREYLPILTDRKNALAYVKFTPGTSEGGSRWAKLKLATIIRDSRQLAGLPPAFAAAFEIISAPEGPTAAKLPHKIEGMDLDFYEWPEKPRPLVALRGVALEGFLLTRGNDGLVTLSWTFKITVDSANELFVIRYPGTQLFWRAEQTQPPLPIEPAKGRAIDLTE